jgi:hypothetical protein
MAYTRVLGRRIEIEHLDEGITLVLAHEYTERPVDVLPHWIVFAEK